MLTITNDIIKYSKFKILLPTKYAEKKKKKKKKIPDKNHNNLVISMVQKRGLLILMWHEA